MGAAASVDRELFGQMRKVLDENQDASDQELFEQLRKLVMAQTAQEASEEQDAVDQESRDASKHKLLDRAASALTEQARNFQVGDVVRARLEGALYFEGIIVDSLSATSYLVDFGDASEEVDVKSLQRVAPWDELEVNDRVEITVPGMRMKFLGIVTAVHADGTYDCRYDDCDEMETGLPLEALRKVGTGRSLACGRWKKAFNTVTAARRFTMVVAALASGGLTSGTNTSKSVDLGGVAEADEDADEKKGE